MQTLLEDVCSLPGVVGSMFCDRRRGLLARSFPSEYDDASLQAVAAALTASVPRLAELTGTIGVVDLRYRDARVVIRPEGDAALLVLCDCTVNAQEVLGFASAVCTLLVRAAAASPGKPPLPVPPLAPVTRPAPAPPAPPPEVPDSPDSVDVPLEFTLPPTRLERTSFDEPRWAQGPSPALPLPATERGTASRRRRRPLGALLALVVVAVAVGYGVAYFPGAPWNQRQDPAATAPASSTLPASSTAPASTAAPAPASSTAAAPAKPPRQAPTPGPVRWSLRLSGAEALAGELAPDLASAFLARQGVAQVQVVRPTPEVAQVRGLADGGAVGVEIRAGDTARALDDLLAGTADAAFATRRATPEEQQKLRPLGPMTSRECEHVLGADGTRRLYLYTAQASSNPSVAKFVEFALSAQGQALVRKAGFVEVGGMAPAPSAPRDAVMPPPAPAGPAEAQPAAPRRARAEPEGPSPALAAALASIPTVPPPPSPSSTPVPSSAPSASAAPAAAPAQAAALEPPATVSEAPDPVAAANPLPQRPAPQVAEDAPISGSTAGQRPRVTELGCVERSIRVPPDAYQQVAGMVVTVRFAVGKDGTPSQYQMTTPGMPESASDALWAAIQSCRWQPGTDETGRPASMWVVLPYQFPRE